MFYVLAEITLLIILAAGIGLLARLNPCTGRRCTHQDTTGELSRLDTLDGIA